MSTGIALYRRGWTSLSSNMPYSSCRACWIEFLLVRRNLEKENLETSKPKSFWRDDPVNISRGEGNSLHLKPPRLPCLKKTGLSRGTEAHTRQVQEH